MAQPIEPLHPHRTQEASGEWQPDSPIEPRVREFGYFPDVTRLLPGDLILTQDLSPDWVSRGIAESQLNAGFPPGHACWTHAAMYLGDGERLVESTFDWNKAGVQVAPLGNYVGTHLLRFRRPTELTDQQRWQMVVEAVSYVQEGYGFIYLWNTWWQTRIGFWQRNRIQRALTRPYKIKRARVCSNLYADTYTRITGWVIDKKVDTPIPATLSQSDMLEDITVGWVKIV